jgi:hypothetical protein
MFPLRERHSHPTLWRQKFKQIDAKRDDGAKIKYNQDALNTKKCPENGDPRAGATEILGRS